MSRTKVAVIGSGNIGTDLMIKVLRLSGTLEMAAMTGIDPASDGLARAARLKVPVTHDGVEGLIAMPGFAGIEIVFDATSAKAHRANAARLAPYGKTLIDLTPAALGPFVVPPVNLDEHLDAGADNLNMVTCGGQATIPMVAAVAAVTDVHYAEIVPGYRLKQQVQFTPVTEPVHTLAPGAPVTTRVSVFLEVEGAAHYLPAYAGNLDIMTSAALRVAESIARRKTVPSVSSR